MTTYSSAEETAQRQLDLDIRVEDDIRINHDDCINLYFKIGIFTCSNCSILFERSSNSFKSSMDTVQSILLYYTNSRYTIRRESREEEYQQNIYHATCASVFYMNTNMITIASDMKRQLDRKYKLLMSIWSSIRLLEFLMLGVLLAEILLWQKEHLRMLIACVHIIALVCVALICDTRRAIPIGVAAIIDTVSYLPVMLYLEYEFVTMIICIAIMVFYICVAMLSIFLMVD